MKFECGDLERALAISELMPKAAEHLKTCPACRQEYRLWMEISSAAKGLREEWESPALWPKIGKALEAEPKPPLPWWREPKLWAIAAALTLALLLPLRLWQLYVKPPPTQSPGARTAQQDFLTDQALSEVEKSEAAYRRSIQKLAALAKPELENPASPAVENDREKLAVLDAAIADAHSNVAINRFNVRLQMALADLYREKQQTLKDVLAREKN